MEREERRRNDTVASRYATVNQLFKRFRRHEANKESFVIGLFNIDRSTNPAVEQRKWNPHARGGYARNGGPDGVDEEGADEWVWIGVTFTLVQ